MVYFPMWGTIYQKRWTDFPVGCKQLFVRSEQHWYMDIHTYLCMYVYIKIPWFRASPTTAVEVVKDMQLAWSTGKHDFNEPTDYVCPSH